MFNYQLHSENLDLVIVNHKFSVLPLSHERSNHINSDFTEVYDFAHYCYGSFYNRTIQLSQNLVLVLSLSNCLLTHFKLTLTFITEMNIFISFHIVY